MSITGKTKNKTYRLKSGKKQGMWQLPTKGQTAIKMVNGIPMEKPIRYVKGANSIFVEDQDKNAKAGKKWFEDGYLIVSEEDWNLNEYINNCKNLDVDFELVDLEKDAEKKVSNIRVKNDIQNTIISETDDNKIRAMAMILISLEAATWGKNTCRNKLLEYSETNTENLLTEISKKGYEGRLLAATAYSSGIVKSNVTHTAVVWADNEGVILRIAQGEKGIDKLGSFFNEGSEAAELVMQEIGDRADRKSAAMDEVKQGLAKPAKTEAEITAAVSKKLQGEFDEKFEQLKKELLSSNAHVVPPVTENQSPDGNKEEVIKESYDKTDVAAVREEYNLKVGKVPPPNMNQNLDWMNAKIEEAVKLEPK